MNKLKTVNYRGKNYKVDFNQTPNYSNTDMRKIGMVIHMTTSNSFLGTKSWFMYKGAQASSLFVIGREVGQIIQMGLPDQKLWHAGRISKPNKNFLAIAKKNKQGKLLNPNLFLDGIEFSGGVDRDKNKKVTKDEIELTEWQYQTGMQCIVWHAEVSGYKLKPKTLITHEDITIDKPALGNVIEEFKYRLFTKKVAVNIPKTENKKLEEKLKICQKKLSEKNNIIRVLIDYFTKTFLKK